MTSRNSLVSNRSFCIRVTLDLIAAADEDEDKDDVEVDDEVDEEEKEGGLLSTVAASDEDGTDEGKVCTIDGMLQGGKGVIIVMTILIGIK